MAITGTPQLAPGEGGVLEEQGARHVGRVAVDDPGGHHRLAVGGDVHGVEAGVDGQAHGDERVVGPLAGVAVRLEHPDAGPQREVGTDGRPHRPHDRRRAARRAPRPTRPSGRRAGSTAGDSERVEQVAVAAVELDAVEPRPLRPQRGIDEAVHDPGRGPRRWPPARSSAATGPENGAIIPAGSSSVTMPDSASGAGGRLRDGTSRGRPSAMSRRLLAAVVHELGGDGGAVAVDVVDQALEPGQVGIVRTRPPAARRRSPTGRRPTRSRSSTRPAPPRARASNHAACRSPTVPSGSPRFVPIGHIAIRFRSSQGPEPPRRQQVRERQPSPELVGVGVRAGEGRDERRRPEHLADALGARAAPRRPAARPTTCPATRW